MSQPTPNILQPLQPGIDDGQYPALRDWLQDSYSLALAEFLEDVIQIPYESLRQLSGKLEDINTNVRADSTLNSTMQHQALNRLILHVDREIEACYRREHNTAAPLPSMWRCLDCHGHVKVRFEDNRVGWKCGSWSRGKMP